MLFDIGRSNELQSTLLNIDKNTMNIILHG